MEVRQQGTAGEDKAPASITKTTQGAKVEPLPGHIRRAKEALLAPYGLTLEAIVPADQRGGDPHTITAINNSGTNYGFTGVNYGTINILK